MIQSFIDSYTLSFGGVGVTQVRTGYGFQPKLVICLSDIRGTTPGSGAGAALMSVGLADATLAMRNVAWKVLDASSPVWTAALGSTSNLLATFNAASGSNSINGAWELSAVGSDGLTTRVTDQYTDGNDPAAIILALGGPAFANVAIGSFTLQDPPGTEVISGLSFPPDGVIMIAPASSGGPSIGAAVRRGAVRSATSGAHCVNGSSPPSGSYTRYGECVSILNVSGAALMQRGNLSAWRNDGFEVTSLDDPTGSLSKTVYYAAFRMAQGFDCRILTGNTASSLTTVDFTTEGDFIPHSGLLVSHGNAQSAAGVEDDDGGLSIGVYTPTQQHGISWYTQDGSAATACTSYSSSSVYTNMGSGDVVQGRMAITGRSKNALTGTMNDADPAPAAVWSLAFGSVPARRGSPLFF